MLALSWSNTFHCTDVGLTKTSWKKHPTCAAKVTNGVAHVKALLLFVCVSQ